MSGYRTQLAMGPLKPSEFNLEGELRWDPIGRRFQMWNHADQVYNYLRFPKTGEDEYYSPQHQWNQTSVRFRRPDGTWGDYVDLEGPAGTPPSIQLEIDNDGFLILTATYGDFLAASAIITETGELIISYEQ